MNGADFVWYFSLHMQPTRLEILHRRSSKSLRRLPSWWWNSIKSFFCLKPTAYSKVPSRTTFKFSGRCPLSSVFVSWNHYINTSDSTKAIGLFSFPLPKANWALSELRPKTEHLRNNYNPHQNSTRITKKFLESFIQRCVFNFLTKI